jgi:hypothetical protein
MKVKLTFTGYYDLPDDPAARMVAYGTEDVAECCVLDRENAEAEPALFLGDLMYDITVTLSPAASPEGSRQ